MKKNNILNFLFFSAILLVFKNWILSPDIIGGDWPYFYEEYIRTFSILPPAWDSVHGNGFGGPFVVYTTDSYLYFTGWLFSNVLHIPWFITYKIVWFGMFLFLGSISLSKFLKTVVPSLSREFMLFGVFLYLTNTYILLVVGGGQMGVALGYAIAPLVLSTFIRLINIQTTKTSSNSLIIVSSLVLALQVLFDFRLAYITMLAVFIYYLLNFRRSIIAFIHVFILPVVFTILLHAFWLLPFIFIGKTTVSQLGAAYTSIDTLSFFSFALFENTFGLLHPNWPENIFGKVGFMKPEFLLLPLLAFSSLLFIKNKELNDIQKKIVVYGVLLALVGIFLAKGTNEPFGEVYKWLFETIPGFVMFRDPTKFYLLIAIAYSLLIPFSLWKILEYVSKTKYKIFNKKYPKILPFIILLLVISYLLILIRPALVGELGGTFAKHTVPEDYVKFKNVLVKDESFSRTMWLPKMQRFGLTSQEHPAVEAESVLHATNSADMIKQIKKEGAEKKLADLSIKYIIIPHDSEKEIFLKDRKYFSVERENIVKELNKLSWLQKDKQFPNLSVYKLNNQKDHIFLQKRGTVVYTKISSTQYNINANTKNANRLIFNENYSPYWILKIGDKEIQSMKYNGMNSFEIPQLHQDLKLEYSLQKFYEIGRVISILTLLALIIILKVKPQ